MQQAYDMQNTKCLCNLCQYYRLLGVTQFQHIMPNNSMAENPDTFSTSRSMLNERVHNLPLGSQWHLQFENFEYQVQTLAEEAQMDL